MIENIKEPPVVLTIAGSDSCGGAGLQADLKTMEACGVYGMSVVTAVTAQNTCEVMAAETMPVDLVTAQLKAVFEDVPPDAVKIGMLSAASVCRVVGEALIKYQPPHVVLDPVMVATSGGRLLEHEAAQELTRLFTCAELVTPNIPEIETLTEIEVHDAETMERSAQIFYDRFGCAVLVKGGHLKETADDLLYDGEAHWYSAERIVCRDVHGTGCTLSSAIASGLALGHPLPDAVRLAKSYVRRAIAEGMDLGHGCRLLRHSGMTSSAVCCMASKSGRE